MQLHKVKRVELKRFEAVLHERREVRVGEQLSVLRRQPAADFGCDDRDVFSLLPALLKDAGDQTLRRVVAVDVCGVKEIDALIQTHTQSV